MTIIIAGSRTFCDWHRLRDHCDTVLSDPSFYRPEVDGDVLILTGGAKGADALGKEYARIRDIAHEERPADWNRQPDGSYDRAAGMKRNLSMLRDAQGLIAFWDGKSKGTKHVIDQARKRGLRLSICLTSPL